MLVGRGAERRTLDALLEAAVGGTGSAVLLRGDPGIGKTALLRSLDDRDGLAKLWTRGFEADATLPFAALVTLLRPVIEHRDGIPDGPRAALEAALAIGPPRSPDRFAAYAGVLALLERATEALGPVLLSVDDAHWLDPSSAEALAYCARRLEDLPVALVVATRIGEGVEPLIPVAHVLTLPPLADADARALLDTAGALAAPVAQEVLRVAEGNPLALREIPAALTDEERDGRAPLPDPLRVTDAIDAAFRRRIERLSDAARRALVVVAAGIDEAADDVRAVCAGLDAGEAAIAEAIAAQVLEESGERLGFTHPLLRAVVLDGAPAPEVREIHRRLAARSAPDRAGWHLAAAAMGPDDEAAAALDVAAQSAAARTAYATASDAFALGAELTGPPDARAHRLLQAAGTGQMAGRFPQAFGHLEAAATVVSDPALAAEIDHLRGLGHTYAGSVSEGSRLLLTSARAAAGAAGADRAARMLVDASMTLGMAGEPRRSIVTVRMARTLGHLDEIGLAKLELADGVARHFAGMGRQLRGREDAIARACDALTPGGPDDLALVCGAFLRKYMGDIAGSHALMERTIAACRQAGALGPLPFHLATLADICWRTTDWAGGRAAAGEAVEIASETGQGPMVAFALCIGARYDAAMGRFDECTGALAAAEPIIEAVNTDALRTWISYARGVMFLGMGTPDRAVEAFAGAVSSWKRSGMRSADSVPWEHDLVEAYVAVGRTTDARARLRHLAEEAHGSDGPQTHALVARCRGLLGPDHERHFEEALAHHARLPVPFEVARTRLLYGERLRRDRRRGRAEEQLRAALETFEALGARPWAERTFRELEAVGAVAVRSAPSAVADLTPRELQVAVGVATGATNAEVAARLFMSEKTVARHLSSVFAKLGVRSRTELAARFARMTPGSG